MMDGVEEAFRVVPRKNFLPKDAIHIAPLDIPISIGHGVTNSQPTTVRMMLEWLDVKPGQKVLDVGSGSGWTTALLAHLSGPKGKVVAVERVPELVAFGQENCHKLGIKNVAFYEAGAVFGYPGGAPYDRILVSASARTLPKELIEQLRPGGKLVILVHEDILEITKAEKGDVGTITHPGFVFVPLI